MPASLCTLLLLVRLLTLRRFRVISGMHLQRGHHMNNLYRHVMQSTYIK